MAYKEFYDVDYESVKLRLKTFLSQQTLLKDYNFEGSAISMWLNFASYIIMYLNSIMNFIGNELFIQSAQLEDNIYKSAYQLNYLPRRKSAPTITLTVTNTKTSQVLIPAYTSFLMETIKLVTTQDYYIPASSSADIQAIEGELITYDYTFLGNDFESFFLDDREAVDQEYFGLYVEGIKWKSVFEQQNYYLANNYFIRYLDNFEIRFDKYDGFFNVPDAGDSIQVKYVKTNGALYNGLTYEQDITFETAFLDSNYLSTLTTDVLKDGLDEEEMESIASNAPLFFSAAGRCVTETDYISKIQELPLYHNMADMIIYSSHKDIVTLGDEYPTETLTRDSKLDKGYYIFSGLRRTVDENDLSVAYTFMTKSEQDEVIAFFEPFKFIQVFGKYKKPNILRIDPTITVKLLGDFDIDKAAFELAIHNYMESKIGFNSNFNISDLITFIKGFDFVNYTSVTYQTFVSFPKPLNYLKLDNVLGFAVGDTVSGSVIGGQVISGTIVLVNAFRNEIVVERSSIYRFTSPMTITNGTYTTTITKLFNSTVIRLGKEITPGSVSGLADGFAIADNGVGAITVNSVTRGSINYDTGYIVIEDRFKFDTYNTISFEFELVDDIAVEFTKETFLDHDRATLEYVA